jgi:hypothetical protein
MGDLAPLVTALFVSATALLAEKAASEKSVSEKSASEVGDAPKPSGPVSNFSALPLLSYLLEIVHATQVLGGHETRTLFTFYSTVLQSPKYGRRENSEFISTAN